MTLPQPFEWDPRKASANTKKHGVPFTEAQTIFADPYGLDLLDSRHDDEERWIRLGVSTRGRLLTVVYTERNRQRVEFIRIISARHASVAEGKAYSERRKRS